MAVPERGHDAGRGNRMSVGNTERIQLTANDGARADFLVQQLRMLMKLASNAHDPVAKRGGLFEKGGGRERGFWSHGGATLCAGFDTGAIASTGIGAPLEDASPMPIPRVARTARP